MRKFRSSFLLAVVLPAAVLAASLHPRSLFGQQRFPEVFDTQDAKDELTSPEESLAKWKVPPGFQISLFAAEPEVRQPIAIATDERGRLWVAENYTYAESAVGFEQKLRDRIIILEDTDGDGRSDRRKVFWDQGDKLTSIEIGQGGVWALCAPKLLFIPDANRDDVPDGEPEVVLDGWNDDAVRHNIVNGLRWGPDGWLYGRHGILATSKVGPPGASAGERVAINCGVWRYHPRRRVFEAVAHGTTNPWGFDFDEHGQMFFINTVIGHLWHVVPGAHYQRMYGVDLNPRSYGLIDQCADHFHWDTREQWSDIRKLGVTETTSQAGGGHAHSGLMIYLGGNWPDEYRNGVFTVNLHGLRLNHDVLVRKGSGYVARHAADFASTSDRWFRGIDLLYGSAGEVYVADWSDVGECHENDGVHRTSGRIYRISHGRAEPSPSIDLAKLSAGELIDLQTSTNDWRVRQARRILQDRAAAGQAMDDVHRQLRHRFAAADDPRAQLRLMWCLNVTGGADSAWLREQISHPSEHVRAWAIRLLADASVEGPASETLAAALENVAAQDNSALVRLFVASACQRLEHPHRWQVIRRLADRGEDAGDAMLPLMCWYAVEPAVPQFPEAAIDLASSSRFPIVRQYIARRLTENIESHPQPVNRLVLLAVRSDSEQLREDIVRGMSEALDGWRKAPAPAAWRQLSERLKTASPETQALGRELSVVFGDGRALDELRALALDEANDSAARRSALRVLAESGDAAVLPLLKQLAGDRVLAPEAIRGLAAFDDADIPQIIIDRYGNLPPDGRERVIDTLTSRPSFARSLLEAVASGRIEAREISAFHARQLRSFGDEELTQRLEQVWGVLRDTPEDKKKQMASLKASLTSDRIGQADLSAGRAVFQKTCGNCHVLYGEGGRIGPDLTGANRQNLDYLLENIVDPSATMASEYKVSLVALDDGRALTGVILQQNDRVVVLQTKDERLSLDRRQIEEIAPQNASLMPEGLLNTLTPEQIVALTAYLQSGR